MTRVEKTQMKEHTVKQGWKQQGQIGGNENNTGEK
jgi:hypothetical protein